MPTLGTPEATQKLGFIHSCHLSSDKKAPLVFLVHGRAGDVKVMWTFRRCIPEHFNVIAVQAPFADPIGGFSWWDLQAPDSDEQRNKSIEQLSKFVDDAPKYYGLKSSKTIALGFSQGAGMLSVVIQKSPTRFLGVGLLAGFVIKLPKSATTQGKTTDVFIAHGTNDDAVSIERGRAGADFLRQKKFEVHMVEDPVGHKVGTKGMRELKEWLLQFD